MHTQVRQWLSAHQWQAGYGLWQDSRRCRSGFGTPDNSVCRLDAFPQPAEEACGGAQDGYEFLVMHRYLLQSLRALWPQREDPFAGWRRFPVAEDYPPFLQTRFYAWPNGVLRNVPDLIGGGATNGHGAAAVPDETAAARRADMLKRWKSEGELGQWLQCGSYQNGLALDSLYGALITNTMPIGDQQRELYAMDFYVFWKTHGWIDQVWEDYRRALGKTPEDPALQAALIQQCRVHQFWVEKSRSISTPTQAQNPQQQAPLYRNGELNLERTGALVRLLGEVVDIQRGPQDKTFFKVDVRLLGVKPIWVSSFAPVVETENIVKMGATYEFIGTLEAADHLDKSGQLRQFLKSPSLLLVRSLQSVK